MNMKFKKLDDKVLCEKTHIKVKLYHFNPPSYVSPVSASSTIIQQLSENAGENMQPSFTLLINAVFTFRKMAQRLQEIYLRNSATV